MRIKRLFHGCTAAVLVLGAFALTRTAPTFAQAVAVQPSVVTGAITSATGTPAATPDPAALAEAETVVVPVVPQAQTPLPADTALPVKFTLGKAAIDGIDPKLTEGVTFEGYARKVLVPVNDGSTPIGQVLVTAVSKEERVEAIDTEGLSSQFKVDDSQQDSLWPDSPVEVKGSRAALIAALQRLAGEPAEETADEKAKVDGENGTSGSDGNSGAASNAAQNDDLANYKAPDATPATSSEKDPVTSVTLTTEGCQIRVDEAQGIAIQQSRTETSEDGVVTDRGTCSDGDKRYSLQKNYSACGDTLSIATLTATANYQAYYVDDGGTSHPVGNCQPDASTTFTISEDGSACAPTIDLSAGTVTPNTALVYTDRSGKSVQVRGCQPSSSKTSLSLIQSYGSCPDKVDLNALTVTRQYRYTYKDANGSLQTVGDCTPGTSTLPVSRSYDGCSEKVNSSAGTVTRQYRLVYTDAEGLLHSLSDCRTDGDSAVALKKSHDACQDEVDLAARTARRRYQQVYTDASGTLHAVSDCTTDTEAAVMAITEDTTACPAQYDLDKELALPQAVLKYTPASGKTVQVRGCAAATDSSAQPLTRSFEACTPLVDTGKQTVTARYQLIHQVDGAQRVVSDCRADSSSTKALVKSYDGCPAVIDLTAMTATRRYTLGYTDAKGVRQTVGDCTADPTQTMMITESVESCPVVVDLPGRKVLVQSLLSYDDADGRTVQVRGCAPGSQTLDITAFYGACTDQVDLASAQAWRRFQWGYLDAKGVQHTVSDCTVDTTSVFAITENTAACPVSIELDARRAVIQAVRSYKDASGKTVQVADCAPSTTKAALPMSQQVAGCSLRHDFTARKSEELGMWVYTLDGQSYQATPCLPTGRTFDHTTVTSANGAYICQPIIVGASVTVQGRERITVDGVQQYITDCAPVAGSSQSLQSTTDGCMDVASWSHDIAGSVSYGQERFYYLRPNGQREYVSDCQTSSTRYAHNHSQSGYENHDASLYAYPLTTISIKVNGIDRVIAVNQVLPGAQQLPYADAGRMNQGTGEYSYEGCAKYEDTVQVVAWQRPDGSTYSQPVGPGPLTSLGDVCTYIRPVTRESWVPQFSNGSIAAGSGYNAGIAGSCPFKATRTVLREDGVVVSRTEATKAASSTLITTPAGFNGDGQPQYSYEYRCYTSSANETVIAAWLVQLGW
ncbi:hypothetical protein [Insolitispirillum peregrinum]|uniref:YD repeat-containing protein n=1 Tax=Insolitispirillum peregrinum TaxID=80876 RepID=A0A1N7MH52_9PROT|nr:hypothetical protein [Insolitispirillum peregrinum]SIS85360.1 hypothetical protein SAMN05421779_104117 [Insolitispirillum peregrinum]